MRKIVFVGAGIAALLAVASVAGCADNSQPYYDQSPQTAQYDAPAPVYAQQPQGGFLDRHGDALLAGGAGYLLGKSAANSSSSYRPTTVIHRTYVTPSYRTYTSRPSYSSFSSRRSSSFGSFRSRRR